MAIEAIWITLDSEAVVNDLNRCIDNQGRFSKEDNLDTWESTAKHLKERAARGAIRITWAKGHANEEHIAAGKTTEVEMHRNREADKLATTAIGKNNASGVVIKAAKQRKRMALIHQTMLVKICLNRQEVNALDARGTAAARRGSCRHRGDRGNGHQCRGPGH